MCLRLLKWGEMQLEMTLSSLQGDLVIIGVFLIIGFILRELIKPLQKIFLPASVIGGVIALISGQQVLGWVELPSSFSQFSGVLINIIMTALILGISLNFEKAKSYMDYTLVSLGVYGLQAGVGILIGAAFIIFWPLLPEGWGVMGVFSFFGGHGTAGAAGAVFADLGIEGNLGIGMILATIGLISGVVIGMIIINYGVRKGWAKYIQDAKSRPNWFYGGSLPKEQQKSIGTEKVTSMSINGLALQFGLILVAMFLGKVLIQSLTLILPFLSVLPELTYGMVGAMIIWPLMVLTKLDVYVDKKTINSINGLLLEIVILTAIATISIELATTFFVPLMIYSIIMVVLTIFIALYFCKKFCSTEWFEKAMAIFGAGTGHAGVALMLVRTIDPDSKSSAAEALGVASGLTAWLKFFVALLPLLLLQGMVLPLIMMFGMGIVSLGLGWFLFARRGSKGVKA